MKRFKNFIRPEAGMPGQVGAPAGDMDKPSGSPFGGNKIWNVFPNPTMGSDMEMRPPPIKDNMATPPPDVTHPTQGRMNNPNIANPRISSESGDILPTPEDRQNMGQKVKQGWQNFQDAGGVNAVIGGSIGGMGGSGGGLLGMAKRILTPKPDPNRPEVMTNGSIGQIKAQGAKIGRNDPYAASGSYGRVIIKDKPPNPDGTPAGYDTHYAPSGSTIHNQMAQDVGMSAEELNHPGTIFGRTFYKPPKAPGEKPTWSMDWTTGNRSEPYAPAQGQPEHPGIEAFRNMGFQDKPFTPYREGGPSGNPVDKSQSGPSITIPAKGVQPEDGNETVMQKSVTSQPANQQLSQAYKAAFPQHTGQPFETPSLMDRAKNWMAGGGYNRMIQHQNELGPNPNFYDRRGENPYSNLSPEQQAWRRSYDEKHKNENIFPNEEVVNEISQQHLTDYIANAIPDYGNKRVEANTSKAMKRHKGMAIAAAKMPFAPDNPKYVKSKQDRQKIKDFKPYYHGERKNPDPQPESGKLKEHAVIAFCRMNPFTKGHQKLIEKVKSLGELLNAHHEIILTSTRNKHNPLSLEEKISFGARFFPSTNFRGTTKEAPAIFNQLERLREEGYKHITIVAGSDRLSSFQQIAEKYCDISVISAGDRTPNELTASRLREAAANNDYITFREGVPSSLTDNDAMDLYLATQRGLEEGNFNAQSVKQKVTNKSLQSASVKNYNPLNTTPRTMGNRPDIPKTWSNDETIKEGGKKISRSIKEASRNKRHTDKLKEDITLPAALLAAKAKFALNPIDTLAKGGAALSALKYLLEPVPGTPRPPVSLFLYPEQGKSRDIDKKKQLTINITTGPSK